MLSLHNPVEIRQLAHFLAVVDTGSVTKAAVGLRLSQPALSRQISQLESALGIRLFDRAPSGLSITAAGLALLPLARGLVDHAEGVRRAAASIAEGAPLRLRVACPEATVRGVIAPFVADTGAPVAGTAIELAARVYALVQDRRADVAVNTTPPPLDLRSEQVDSAPIDVYVPPDHPLAALDEVDATDLAGASIIVLESGSGLRRVVDDALRPERERISIVAEPSSSELAKSLAAAGVGVCIDLGGPQFGLVARRFTSQGRRVQMPIYAAWRADHFAAEQLAEFATALTSWSLTRERE